VHLPVEVDVVVVGAGAGGLVAAATAAGCGASVTLVERACELGGTATVSIGEFWVPNNVHLRRLGIDDPEADCLALMARLSYPDTYVAESATLGLTQLQYELLRTYYHRASEAAEYLDQIGALHSRISPAAYGDPLGHPEYHSDLSENRVPQGRHLIVDDGDPAFGLRGQAYVRQLSDYLARTGVSIRTGCRVRQVERDGTGRVVAVLADSPDGPLHVTARRGVIFATGGFGHDRNARETFLPGPVDGVAAVETATGDFLRIGQGLGAALANMTSAYLGNAAFELAISQPRIPALIHFPFGDSMMWVDTNGRRVVNEKGVFNDRARAHFDWDATGRRRANRVLIQVFDRVVLDAPGARYPLGPPGELPSHVIAGDSWPELAVRVDERLAQLTANTGGARLGPDFADQIAASVRRFDAFACEGVDLDFGRGGTPIQTCYEQSLHAGLRNPTMAPFTASGPYYAMLIGPAMFDTSGGPAIDTSSRVLDVSGSPIEGLFGTGGCIASPGGAAYWSGGAPIGLALTFGYIAARTATAG
jgi:3-oxosteroid 1-dehydrogenase